MPLMVAAGLVVLEAVVLVGYAVVLVPSVSSERLAMGVTTPIFFALYGAGLVVCARALTRLRSWARAPVVLAQLIQLGVAWSFRGGSSTPEAVALAVVAAGVLAALFHPASVNALSEDDPV
jgi:hypothetical protein